MRRAGFLACFLVAGLAQGQPADGPAGSPPSGATGLEQVSVSPHWGRRASRAFVAGALEAGYTYIRPRFAVGVGQPYQRWIGLEAAPTGSMSGVGAYVGAKGQVPLLELRAGARYFAPVERSLFVAKESHSRLDIERRDGPSATYTALEAEMAGSVPVRGGGPFWVLSVYYISSMPEGYHLFEESLKVVIEPPWVWRARVGYAVSFGKDDAISLGVAQENLVLPGRTAHVLRAGVLARVRVSDTLEAQATLLPVLYSPDRIGLAGADFAHLGVRWRFATD